MTGPNGTTPPLLDSSVLEALRDELEGDERIWKKFVQDFITQLPGRTERQRLALLRGDMEGAMDAVLSIRTSSQMIGAQRLASLALHLEQSLRDAARQADPEMILPQLAATPFQQISQCSQDTLHHLGRYLI